MGEVKCVTSTGTGSRDFRVGGARDGVGPHSFTGGIDRLVS